MRIVYLFLFIVFTQLVIAQATAHDDIIIVNGKVVNNPSNTIDIGRVMIINKRTGNGTFTTTDGAFAVTLMRNDTLMFAYSGYNTKKICFKDSVNTSSFYIAVRLERLSIQLKEIAVYPVKKLEEIESEIEQFEKKKKLIRPLPDFVESIESPITALYMRFSRFEQSKRKVAEMENEDRKRDILKDLFRLYVKHEIIDLSDEQFDDFITFCNLDDYFIVNATQYQLVEAVKLRYYKFAEMNDYVRYKR